MKRQGDEQAGQVAAKLEHEMTMIREAVAMVASGGAPRVTVAGLRFGEELLGPARRLAAGQGVRIVPLFTADEQGADLRVERDDD